MLVLVRTLILTIVFFSPRIHASDPGERLFNGAPLTEKGQYSNVGGDLSHGGASVRIPFMLRRFGTYFRSGEGAPELALNDGAGLRDFRSGDIGIVTWVGHATLLVQMAGVTFLTDPIWSNWPSPVPYIGPRRYVAPGIAIEDLPPIDFVVISHNHYDHLDLPTLKKLADRDPGTQFFVPLGNGDLLRENGITQIQELDWGDTVTVKGSTVYCLPAQHWSKRSITDTNKALWSSWAVIGTKKRFYFTGDTGYFAGFEEIGQKLGPFDLAAVPIGAYEPKAMMHASHMNPEEALQAVLDVRAENAIAIHYGTFDLSDEALQEPPFRFQKAASSHGMKEDRAWVIKIGESREF